MCVCVRVCVCGLDPISSLSSSPQLVDDVPAVEWWDADVLHSRSYIDLEKPLPREQKYHGISNLIEHPIPVQPAGQ